MDGTTQSSPSRRRRCVITVNHPPHEIHPSRESPSTFFQTIGPGRIPGEDLIHMDAATAILVPATSHSFLDSSAETVMRSSPVAKKLVVSHDHRKTLERWIRMPTAPQRLVLRSRIVLLLADGCPARDVARRLGVSRPTVALWRRRFSQEGLDALTRDRPGRGRKPGITPGASRRAGGRMGAKQSLVSSQRNLSASRQEQETARDGNCLYQGDDSASRDRSAPHRRGRSSEIKR